MLIKNFVWDFIKEHKFTFITYILIIVTFFPIEGIVLPNVYGKLFELFKKNVKVENFGNVFTNIKKQNIQGAITLLLIVWMLIVGSGFLKHEVESTLIPEYMKYTRNVIYKHTIEAYSDDYRDMKSGEYLSRVLELTRNMKDLFQYSINRLIPESIVSIIIVGYLFINHTYLGITNGVCIFMCGLIQWIGGSYIVEKVKSKEDFFNSIISENIRDSLDNLMNVYLNNEVATNIDKNEELEEKNNLQMKEIMSFQNKVVVASEVIILLCYGISLYLIYKLLIDKKITISQAIIYTLVIGQFVSYMININIGLVHNVSYKLGIIESSRNHLKSLFVDNKIKTKTDCINSGNVRFKNVSFNNNKKNDDFTVDNVTFKLDDKKKYGIIGRSGSGKTTLMKLMAGLYPVDSGEITIDGTNIKYIKREHLRENVNYVNQKTSLFNESVISNMLYGNEHVTQKEMISKLKKYKLLEVFSGLHDGIYTSAGVHGNNLSGGMQKLTMLMRGIVKNSKIMILDEPLAGLDQGTRMKVIDMINIESEGKTLIVITHDKEILPHMEHIIDINKI